MRPFSDIMSGSKSEGRAEIREFIVQCVSRLVLARAHNVKSGWRIVLSVFTDAVADKDEALSQLSFELIGTVVHDHLELLSANDALDELVKGLIAAATNVLTDNSLLAVGMLQSTALHLSHSEHDAAPLDDDDDDEEEEEEQQKDGGHDREPNMQIIMVPHPHRSLVVGRRHEVGVRTRALGALFHVLRTHGRSFSANTWRMLFSGVLLPIFDDVRHSASVDADADHTTACECPRCR